MTVSGSARAHAPLTGMLVVERRGALLFRSIDEVALVMEEYAGRVTVVMADGEVVWRGGPAREVAGGGLVEILPGVFANPRHARRDGASMEFPGGWIFRKVPSFAAPQAPELPVPPAPHGPPVSPAPPADASPPDPMVSYGAGRVRASSVLYLHRRGGGYVLRCKGRTIELEGKPRELFASHPWLVRMGSIHINARRLREIRPERKCFRLQLDTGDSVTIAAPSAGRAARELGLQDLRSAGPRSATAQVLYDEGLRDWPRPLLEMPLEVTRPLLGNDRRMAIANAVWQVVRMGAAGTRPDYGTDIRGFWYLPLFPLLNRLGAVELASPGDVMPVGLELPCARETGLFGAVGRELFGGGEMKLFGASDAAYHQYEVVLGDLIGRSRLFTYEELGFEDPRPDQRGIGAVRPHVVLAVEKFSLMEAARQVAARFGITFLVMGGDSSWLGVEFFARALRPVLPPGRKVEVVSYGDYDPSGWRIADSFIVHLERYGIGTESLRRLVVPARFTAEEIALIAYRLPGRPGRERTIARAWVRRSGGVGGKALGLHADHLRPVDRVITAFREETGLEEIGP